MKYLWNALGRKLSIQFGTDCAVASIWMLFTLILRALLIICQLSEYIPQGLIFALPFFIQVPYTIKLYHLSIWPILIWLIFVQALGSIFPSLSETSPLLIVRMAESILGRFIVKVQQYTDKFMHSIVIIHIQAE